MKGIKPMAFDGITTKHLIKELQETIVGGRIRKIYQPESDEIRMTINREKENYNLLISANANNPRVYLAEKLKENPGTPPSFCMVLRKHLLNGIIVDIVQHETDRGQCWLDRSCRSRPSISGSHSKRPPLRQSRRKSQHSFHLNPRCPSNFSCPSQNAGP